MIDTRCLSVHNGTCAKVIEYRGSTALLLNTLLGRNVEWCKQSHYKMFRVMFCLSVTVPMYVGVLEFWY